MKHDAMPTRNPYRPDDAEVAIDVQFGARLLQRRAGLIVVVLLIGLSAAAAYLQTQTPTYVSTAKLLIESHRSSGGLPDSGDGPDVDSAQVESQVEILRASIVAEAVVRKLNLVADPEFVPPRDVKPLGLSWLDALQRTASRIPGAAKFLPSPTSEVVVVEPARTEDEMLNTAIASFGDRISVRRLGQSNAIEINFAANSPAKAQRVASQTVDVYLSGVWRSATSPNAFRRFNDDVMHKSLAVSNARVISGALQPLGKSSPKTMLVLAFAAAASLFVGVALAVWLEGRQPARRAPGRGRRLENVTEGSAARERTVAERGDYSFRDVQP